MAESEKKARHASVGVKTCAQITCVVLTVMFLIWWVYSVIQIKTIQNRLDYHRACIDASEYGLLPKKNPATMLDPAPFVRGYFAIDFGQLEVDWQLFPVLYNHTLDTIDLRGPLTHTSPYTAPVALAMGLQMDKRHKFYEGRLGGLSGKLAAAILERPHAYYVSFHDANGTELMRDSLAKTCYSNL